MAKKLKGAAKKKPKKVEDTNPVGRPTDYKTDYNGQAYKLCLLGATDKEIADFFGVNPDTIYEWKNRFPEFSESITRGKTGADANVAEKLYQRALGYSHTAVKIFQDKGDSFEHEYTEHYPPDTQAASLWLRNRQPGKWRDKQDIEHSGNLTIGSILEDIDGRSSGLPEAEG